MSIRPLSTDESTPAGRTDHGELRPAPGGLPPAGHTRLSGPRGAS
ncbi:hypothetical protein [Streptomyces sp. 184]